MKPSSSSLSVLVLSPSSPSPSIPRAISGTCEEDHEEEGGGSRSPLLSISISALEGERGDGYNTLFFLFFLLLFPSVRSRDKYETCWTLEGGEKKVVLRQCPREIVEKQRWSGGIFSFLPLAFYTASSRKTCSSLFFQSKEVQFFSLLSQWNRSGREGK